MTTRLGISGAVAKAFLHTEITPLLAFIGLLLGAFAIAVTPREEEPQINVTFANVFIPFPGAQPSEVEHLVARPAEQVLSEIEGVEHVYSLSRAGMAVLTVRYEVGEDRTRAIVRLYNKIFSNEDWLPANLGVGQPLIKPKGIDDVPIVTLTLWSKDPAVGAFELQQVAHAMEAELKRVADTREIYTVGGPDRVVHVLLDPQRLAGFNIALDDVQASLNAANTSVDAANITRDNREILVQAGVFLSNAEEVGQLVVGIHDDAPVYLWEVADIRQGPDQPEQYVWFGTGPAAAAKEVDASGRFPAVTLAVAKKPGTNAVEVANHIIERVEQLKGIFIPEGVNVTVTRNYGATADEKAQTLIHKLIFATSIVVALVFVTLGWREAFIVGSAVVITLAVTLFLSWAWGFTLNRVSLFALIFSIGILVDDAIVVVENIHRHIQMGGRTLSEAIPIAVDEVGGPTILATFTVVAALLPMAFVTGLMGPYMSPIPINASMGMLVSLAVAFVITPWLTYHILQGGLHGEAAPREADQQARLERLFQWLIGPFLVTDRAKRNRWLLLVAMLLFIIAAVSLVAFQAVILKMLPFDNKSELQVVIDMPEGTSLEQTARVSAALGDHLATVPEVTDYQNYNGTASPISFNGLVRQYYLREGAYVGDIQVNLVDKAQRERKSHDIALSIRPDLDAIARRFGANVKVVEVPPGPPVLSSIVAEVYGLDYTGQIEVAKRVREVFEATANVVDVDDSVEALGPKWIIRVDRQKAALLGLDQRGITDAIGTLLNGYDVAFLRALHVKYPIPIRLELPVAEKADLDAFLSLRLRSRKGDFVPLSEVVEVLTTTRPHSVSHKDLLPVVYVTADLAGGADSPLYGMFKIYSQLKDLSLAPAQDAPIQQFFIQAPTNPYRYSLKWNGEWQVTYETFRDMGIAYAVGLILIYLLIVAQFRSYLVPLIIMVPIPLTVIGVMPGHAILGQAFTATSMIGMIALAGIIVRNSILLVDFINEEWLNGISLHRAVIRASAVRAKPIALTALAAILGAFFIVDDPIFSGLAISLIFGIFVSTLLTLMIIPVMYYAFMRRRTMPK